MSPSRTGADREADRNDLLADRHLFWASIAPRPWSHGAASDQRPTRRGPSDATWRGSTEREAARIATARRRALEQCRRGDGRQSDIRTRCRTVERQNRCAAEEVLGVDDEQSRSERRRADLRRRCSTARVVALSRATARQRHQCRRVHAGCQTGDACRYVMPPSGVRSPSRPSGRKTRIRIRTAKISEFVQSRPGRVPFEAVVELLDQTDADRAEHGAGKLPIPPRTAAVRRTGRAGSPCRTGRW